MTLVHRYKYGKLVVVDSRMYCLSSSGCEVLDVDDDPEWRPVSPSRHQPDSVASLGPAIYSVSRGRAEVYCPDKGTDLHQGCQHEPLQSANYCV